MIVWRTKPRISASDVEKVAKTHRVTDKVVVVGIRGYYAQSMGGPGNDRGIFDDCIAVLSPTAYATYNANTDPSHFRPGIASLVKGVHPYRRGKHGLSRPNGGYPAFRPATKGEVLPVLRDGETGISDGIAINIHKGSYNSTSSAGCQTVYPAQWNSFYALLDGELKRHDQKVFSYVLV
jgi:lysozyme